MKKIIVLTLLLSLVAMPVIAGTDWSKFEGGGGSIKVENYTTQPGHVTFYQTDGTIGGYLYWNKVANEPFVVTPDEVDWDYPLGVPSAGITTNIGVALSQYTGSGVSD